MGIPFAGTAPISIASVGLKARDADALARFYREVVGLEQLSRGGGTIALGAGDRILLEIEQDAALAPDDPRAAGLFHTAFLLPSRTDLGRWLRHAAANRIALEGASDHLVSEALYLSDPEGNGIEIYADRPRGEWKENAGGVAMATLPLDIRALANSVPEDAAAWSGFPSDGIIGHVHLRVGEVREAERWWHETFGFQTMARYGAAAVFLATGGYHHHIGANSWQSAGAGKRDPGKAGLAWVELVTSADSADSSREVTDPWGTIIRLPGGRS